MKKMLTLVLVLAVASLANAAFVIVDGGGNSSTTVIGAGSTTLYLQYVGTDLMQYDVEFDADNAGVLSTGSHVTTGTSGYIEAILYAPGTATGHQMEITGGYDDSATTFASGVTLAQFDVSYGLGVTTVSGYSYLVYGIDWVDVAANVGVTGYTITANVPEPITMALLGIGGLFLRRKK